MEAMEAVLGGGMCEAAACCIYALLHLRLAPIPKNRAKTLFIYFLVP